MLDWTDYIDDRDRYADWLSEQDTGELQDRIETILHYAGIERPDLAAEAMAATALNGRFNMSKWIARNDEPENDDEWVAHCRRTWPEGPHPSLTDRERNRDL